MDFRTRAEKAVQDCCEALSAELTDEQRSVVSKIVERAIIDAIREAAMHTARAATRCCSEDRDMAHKISREIDNTKEALIANLSGLR